MLLLAAPAFAQREHGEIRLAVRDPKGGPLEASVELASAADQMERHILTERDGHCTIRELPFGTYRLEVSHQGFVSTRRFIHVWSEVPLTVSVTLGLAPLESRIEVPDSAAFLDPERAPRREVRERDRRRPPEEREVRARGHA